MITIEIYIGSLLSQKLSKVNRNGAFIHHIHKWRTRGKKTGTFSHESEALLANLQNV